jgi:2-keto-3-deoxy-L-fuconate dehydrogenase
MFSLKGKSAVITGGGSGIGRAIAVLFAKQGALVHVIEVNDEASTGTVSEISKFNGEAIGYKCDVTSQQQVVDIFNKIGAIDILVNNAGIAHIGRADNTSEEDFTKVFNVNVKGAYNCLFAAIPLMKNAGKGAILNMASIASIVGITDRFAYSMSKGAIFSNDAFCS